ncbi:MAG: FAD-binding oxidoreductase [Gammaproteobacteria bacterium]
MHPLTARCVDLLGTAGVIAGADARARGAGIYSRDHVLADLILRPASTAQVAAVVALCDAVRQPLVLHGGLTNLVDSARSAPGGVVLSLERMNAIEELDVVGRTMTVQAGAVLQSVQERAAAAGLMFGVDLGARGTCQIGGNLSTNAGGNRVIRYGMTRENVLGVEAVLADGTVVPALNRMIKNNAGYDLKHLFIGSEGSLGVVTRAVLRLREAPASQSTAFAAFSSFDAVAAFLKHMDRSLGGMLSAFEVMWREFYLAVTTPPARGRAPIDGAFPYYALVELLGADQAADAERFESALAAAAEAGIAADVVVARSAADRAAMWGLRDDVEQMFRYGPAFIFDVSLAIRDMQAYVEAVREGLSARFPDHHCLTFGHIGDGNIHFAIAAGGVDAVAREAVEACVYRPLRGIGGSVSAEHGIGLDKKRYLPWCRDAAEIALMRRLKLALDPNGTLNAGLVFDL